MLECNRLSDNTNINEEEDIYKNNWTNNVSNYGIEVKQGDVINLESASINTVGSISNTIEFVGDDNITDDIPLDNKCRLIMGQYITHTGQFTARLPLSNSQSYVSYDNPSQATKFNFFRYCRNRGLGEYDLSNYGRTSPRLNYSDEQRLPTPPFMFNIQIVSSGAGYRIGDECSIVDNTGTGSGSGMTITITDILDEGIIQGAVSRLKLTSLGDNGYSEQNVLDIVPPTQRQGFVQATLSIIKKSSLYFSEIFTDGADGLRYYPAGENFTGCAMVNYENSGATDENTAPFLDLGELQSDYLIRTVDLDLEVPIGLNQPDDIAENLTKQMKTPSLFNTYTKPQSKYFNYKDAEALTFSTLNSFNVPLIETDAYTINPASFSPLSQIRQSGSLAGSRRLFYSNIAYQDPFKLEGLGWTLSLPFDSDNVSGSKTDFNAFNSGKNQIDNIGDFNNQTVGNLGIRLSLMSQFEKVNNLITISRNQIVITNMYFTEENIEKIGKGFRKIERYFGDMSNQVDKESKDYKDYLTCILDIGRLCDEKSRGTLGDDENDPPAGARIRFCSGLESTTDDTDTMLRNVDFVDTCIGTQNDFTRGKFDNDGFQLSSLPVRSRYSDDILYENNLGDFQFYQQITSELNSGIDTSTMFYVPSTTPTQEVFQGSGYEDYIALSKKHNVACVPIYPQVDDEFKQGVNTPYICFISAITANDDRNNSFVKETNTEWTIDAGNANYGQPLGYDPSFIRNPAVMMFNNNTAFEPSQPFFSDPKANGQGVFLGANNISIDFNPTFDRFTFSNLSTPMTIGQGTIADIEYGNGVVKDSNDNPEQICFNTSLLGQYASTSIRGTLVYNNGWDVKQSRETFIDSYTGLSLLTVELYFKNNRTQEFNNFITDNKESIIQKSLLGKLGFKFSDLLPKLGNIQQNLIQSTSNLGNTYEQVYSQLSPITSGLYISSSEYQATATNILNQPTFDISYNLGKQTRPDASSSLIVATNLPSKLDYPFLTIHSSLPSMGTDTLYYGSKNSNQKVPVMGYVPRYNNEGNFFYGLESSYNFTATKDFVLSEIDTRIMLPNGSRPRLNLNSSVIYKITKITEEQEVVKK